MRERILVLICVVLGSVSSVVTAADSVTRDPDGVVTWTPAQPGPHVDGNYKPSRWGMYDVEAVLDKPAEGKISATIGDKKLEGVCNGAATTVKLGRLYIDTESQRSLSIDTAPADKSQPIVVKSLVFAPAPEGNPIIQSGDLSITLHAHDATVHSVTMRYEFRPDKNTLGYWSNPKDWVSWDFEVKKPGKFIVVVMQGSPVSKPIQITVAGQTLNYTTKNTTSYHTFTFLEVGTVTIDKPGNYTLSLKPQDAKGPVMDLRQIILLPVLK